jgi:hypothetical protein
MLIENLGSGSTSSTTQFYLVIFGVVVELESQQNKIALYATSWLK